MFRASHALPVALLALAVFVTGTAMAETVAVRQKDKSFIPERVSIAQGASVAVSNDDPVIHHLYVDSPGMQFDSGEQRPGTVVSIPFARAGGYSVRCAIHPRMRLDVDVAR